MARAKIFFSPVFWVLLAGMVLQAQPNRDPNRLEKVRTLSKQLRWHDVLSRQEYERTRDVITDRMLAEVDGFIADNFDPRVTTAHVVEAGLDALLGYEKADAVHNGAFLVNLGGSRFLIVAVEVRRGGNGIAEDATSVRAYKQVSGRFGLVAHAADIHSSNPGNPYRVDLRAKLLPISPVPGESWLIASTIVTPSQAPPAVAIRLYAFDGTNFRTVWAPADIIAEGPDEAVQLIPDGFLINMLFDPTGQAAHSPTVVIHDRYVLTAEGPRKLNQWETQRQ